MTGSPSHMCPSCSQGYHKMPCHTPQWSPDTPRLTQFPSCQSGNPVKKRKVDFVLQSLTPHFRKTFYWSTYSEKVPNHKRTVWQFFTSDTQCNQHPDEGMEGYRQPEDPFISNISSYLPLPRVIILWLLTPSVSFSHFWTVYKWNYVRCIHLYLVSFAQHYLWDSSVLFS